MSLQTAIQLLGGVGIFLFAIKLLSDSLQALADNKLRSLIATLTRTPVLGVIVGTVATIFLQSSSATTVMTISFVDAGLMTLKQAVGVIMGANIGTTVTGQIVAFNVKDFAYVFVIAGVLLNFISKSKAKKDLGIGIIAFGLLFIGMQTMENAMYFLRERKDIFLMFADNHFLGLLAGAGLTLLVQSSSATIGITIALATQGLMPIEAAMPIILGMNVGTTITAMLAALGTSRSAKQTSAAHVLFNLIAVIIFYPLMPFYIPLIELTASTAPHQIANAQTFLNIINTLVFIPFVGPFTKLIRFLIPDEKKEAKKKISTLDPLLIQTSPIAAVDALKNECFHMAEITLKQLNALEEILFQKNVKEIDYIHASEKDLNLLYEEISAYASRLTSSDIPLELRNRIYNSLAFADDLERMGDKTSQLIMLYSERVSANQDLSANLTKSLHEVFIDARQVFRLSYFFLSNKDEENNIVGDPQPEIQTETAKENAEQLAEKNLENTKTKLVKMTQQVKTTAYNALLHPEVHDEDLNQNLEHSYVESVRILERIANRANSWVK